MNRRAGQWIFALVVGLMTAVIAYRWITDPGPRIERAAEEAAVQAARTSLADTLGIPALEIVDPLAPDRKVGKAYVFRSNDGWEVSGHYRRGESDSWHPFLMALDGELMMTGLKVKDADAALAEREKDDARLDIVE